MCFIRLFGFCFFFYRNQSIFDFSLCESGYYFARSRSRRQRVSVSRRRGNKQQKVSIFPNSVKTVFQETSAHLILFWGHCLLLILSPQQALECDHKHYTLLLYHKSMCRIALSFYPANFVSFKSCK